MLKRIPLFCQESGYSEKAVARKIEDGVWVEGREYDASGIVTTESDGSRYPLTVLDFPRDKDKVHPTQKPVALMEYLIRTYTNEGDTVLDNTMGSGTTGVACENTGRRFIGIERDPTYFDVAVGRISDASLFGPA